MRYQTELEEVRALVREAEERNGVTAGGLRNNPRFSALYRVADRAKQRSETREVKHRSETRANARPAPTPKGRTSPMNENQLRHEAENTVRAMRDLMDETGGRLGNQFGQYQELEDRLEGLAGRIGTRTGQLYGPRINDGMSREDRLDAWAQFIRNESSDERGGLQSAEGRSDEWRNGAGSPFRSLADQLLAVIRSQTPGHSPDPRLFQTRATGMNEGVGGDGGFLVQTDFSSSIWARAFDEGQILRQVRRIPISTSANGIKHAYVKETSRANGSRRGGLRVYRKAEAGTVAASKPNLEQFSLQLETGMALLYLTDELLEDAAQLDAFIRAEVPKEISFMTEDEILNGNGVGRCLGILNAPALVTVAKESGQAAGSLLAENVEKMFARMPARSLPTSAWYINQALWPQIFQLRHLTKNVAGTENVSGDPMFTDAGGLPGAPAGTLLGRPIIPVEYCAAPGTVGDIIFADFGQYTMIEKGGVKTASSIHVQFIYGEQVLRFTWRNNGAPGYAWADGPLTPFKGSDAISPFIALATRS
jgi:HK97 family phage major capsid protein